MKICAITMVYNESKNLPRWISYYSSQLGLKNLYLLDNESSDDSVKSDLGCSIVRVPRSDGFSDTKRARFVSSFVAGLLNYYDVVIYSDCDEFLIANPNKYSGLREFFEKNPAPYFTCLGMNLIHIRNVEPSLGSGRVLSQRRHVVFSHAMCKTLATRVPINWAGGFHSCNFKPSCGDLLLIHTKSADFDEFKSRLSVTRNIDWSVGQEKAPGHHQRMSDRQAEDTFDRWSRFRCLPLTQSVLDEVSRHIVMNFESINFGLRKAVRYKPMPLENLRRNVYVLDENYFNLF